MISKQIEKILIFTSEKRALSLENSFSFSRIVLDLISANQSSEGSTDTITIYLSTKFSHRILRTIRPKILQYSSNSITIHPELTTITSKLPDKM